MKKPVIGIVIPNDFVKRLPFGGGSGLIENLVNAFESQVVIFGAGVNGTPIWCDHRINDHVTFVAIYPVKFPSRVPLRLQALFGYLNNRKRILSQDIDVLYVHSPECALPFIYGTCRKPLVFHQHGSGNPVKTATFSWARNQSFAYLFDLIQRKIYLRSDWLIAIDRYCQEQAVACGAANKTSLLMNAVDMNFFRPDEALRIEMIDKHGLRPNVLKLLFVGRLEEIKQVDRLIECLAILAKDDIPVQLFIVGDGTKRNSLEKLAEELVVSREIHFLGNVSQNELLQYYNLADTLVLPSKMEGVPMVILESLACGTPIVASAVGGIPDLIKEGKNGFLLNDVSSEEIRTGILKVKNAYFNREQVAETVSEFSAFKVAKELSKIFNHLTE